MSRFVEVPVAAVKDLIKEVALGVNSRGGKVVRSLHGREVVYDVHHPRSGGIVRLYTSAADGAEILRGCDADAVRVIIGVELDGEFRPTHKSQKLLRTAPQKLPQSERVEAFITRVREALRMAYRKAGKSRPHCPDCGTPMALRKAKKTGNEFLGCLAYPECKTTTPVG
jgi:hypothetical protein